MRNRMNRAHTVAPGCELRLGRIALSLSIITLAVLSQACTRILDNDLGAIGDGIITPAPVPTGPMAVDVRVVSDPQGGSYISELSCVLEVSEIPGGGSNPIPITVNWVAPCGTHKSEVFVFDGGTKTYETTYSENGRSIALTFWTTISWRDAQGNHQIRSGMAACI